MKKIFPLLLFSAGIFISSFAQNISELLASRTQNLLRDGQMKNASLSFCVADATTGDLVYQYDCDRGLSPASTQKIFTTIAAFEILGDNYTFKTNIGYNGNIANGALDGDLIVEGFGDPSFGSWRFDGFKPQDIENKILSTLATAGISAIDGNIIIDESKWGFNPTPGGWSWNDMGNYYGAGDWGVNWNENQVDITLQPASDAGGSVAIAKTEPALQNVKWVNHLSTSGAGASNTAAVYVAPYAGFAYLDGFVPAGNSVTITGVMPNPPAQFGYELKKYLLDKNIKVSGKVQTAADYILNDKNIPEITGSLAVYRSPELRILVYSFLQKSINLYGESFAKAIGWQEKNNPSAEAGTSVIQQFWAEQGVNISSLKMLDGSGLSPQNQVTARAEITALLYAQKQDWFSIFYKALPVNNGMKMKSGTIGGCKAFAGYQTSQSGRKFVFSMIINNYFGSQYNLIPKMYKVLDALK